VKFNSNQQGDNDCVPKVRDHLRPHLKELFNLYRFIKFNVDFLVLKQMLTGRHMVEEWMNRWIEGPSDSHQYYI